MWDKAVVDLCVWGGWAGGSFILTWGEEYTFCLHTIPRMGILTHHTTHKNYYYTITIESCVQVGM